MVLSPSVHPADASTKVYLRNMGVKRRLFDDVLGTTAVPLPESCATKPQRITVWVKNDEGDSGGDGAGDRVSRILQEVFNTSAESETSQAVRRLQAIITGETTNVSSPNDLLEQTPLVSAGLRSRTRKPRQPLPFYPRRHVYPRRPRGTQQNSSSSSSSSSRRDGDASNLLWLLDYKLDNLLKSPLLPENEEKELALPETRQMTSTACVTTTTRQPQIGITESMKKLPDQMPTKPPFTYTQMIEQVMIERGEVTVAEIYSWITEHFPFYKSCDDRWKNSVRHNLSMNPYFKKGPKPKNGSGHLWGLSSPGFKGNIRRTHVRSVCPAASETMPEPVSSEFLLCDDPPSPANDIWLSSAAAENKENVPNHTELNSVSCLANYFSSIDTTADTITLEESAERILSGAKDNVEVQFITPVKPSPYHETMLLDCPLDNPLPL